MKIARTSPSASTSGPMTARTSSSRSPVSRIFQVATATYHAARKRWPKAALTLRQGARVIEASRRSRLGTVFSFHGLTRAAKVGVKPTPSGRHQPRSSRFRSTASRARIGIVRPSPSRPLNFSSANFRIATSLLRTCEAERRSRSRIRPTRARADAAYHARDRLFVTKPHRAAPVLIWVCAVFNFAQTAWNSAL